jgi:hypothetical protein
MERQLLDGVGAGIRYLAVEHEERSQSSPEEAGLPPVATDGSGDTG